MLLAALSAAALALTAPSWTTLHAHPEHSHGGGTGHATVPAPPLGPTSCVGGFAGPYPCARVKLESFLPMSMIGGGQTNDIWGWTDATTRKEYALVGRTNGTAFVDISSPGAPRYLGNLPTHSQSSTWRGIKVYADHAFIVSEAPSHGLQVFDLVRLRTVVTPPVTFTESAHYNGFATAHTVAINEETGFLYAAGTNTCSGGLHMVDIRVPSAPRFAGCFSADGYTHETQCVVYRGLDPRYAGREVCFNANVDTVTIVDVSNKAAPTMLARKSYPGRGYTHQGWLSEDHRYFLLDDEKDETKLKTNTRTHVFDVANLTAPQVVGVYEAATIAIDHNQYVRDGHTFQANYASGLRVLDLEGVANADLKEIGFFDVRPEDNHPDYSGAWSTFPFFASGVVVVSAIERGLFVLRPTLAPMTRPDLIVAASTSAALSGAGETLAVSAVTKNQGGALASASVTEFYLSADDSLTPDDERLGARSVPLLGRDAAHTSDAALTIPGDMPSGRYFLLAVSDSRRAVSEDIENNNTRPRAIAIGPDLTVTILTASLTAARGASVSVNDTINNGGGARADGTLVRLFLSQNANIDATDVALAAHSVPPLDAGEVHSASMSIVIPTTTLPGVYYLIAHVDRDDVVDEIVETNNVRTRKVTIQ
jgi:choice-of-anchor B domain-containing protein